MRSYECIERDGSAASAVLLHPHPDMGGNCRHPLIDALFRGLPLTTCRFDFSSSVIETAQEQVAAALDRAPGPGIVLVGYSFGADIALTVVDPRVLGWFLIAPPLRVVEPATMGAALDPRPKYLAVPQFDQFCPPPRATEVTAGWTSTTVAPIAHGDHFLAGRGEAVVEAARAWLPSLIPSP